MPPNLPGKIRETGESDILSKFGRKKNAYIAAMDEMYAGRISTIITITLTGNISGSCGDLSIRTNVVFPDTMAR